MAVVELDPFFVKALKLLQSRSKESTDQLKQMLVEALAIKKVKTDLTVFAKDEDDRWEQARASSPARLPSTSSFKDTSDHGKKRESEKRPLEKIKSEPVDNIFEPKKPKLEARPSPSHTPEPRPDKVKDRDKSKDGHKDKSKDSHKEKSKDSHKDKSKDSHSEKSRDREKSHREREKAKEREREKEREKEKEKIKEKEIKWDLASNDSDDDMMDADNFALDMGITCIVCKQMNQSSGNQLVECQECHNLYHQECHRPPVTEQDVNDPRFVWYCSRCTKNMKKMVSKPTKPKVQPITIPKEPLMMKPPKVETPTLLPFKRVLDPVKPTVSKELASSSSRGQGMGLAGLASLAANLSGGKESTKVKLTTPDSASKMLKNPFEPLGAISKATAPLSASSKSDPRAGAANPMPTGLAALANAAAAKSEKGKTKTPVFSADKRLQMMKKKAAEKQLAKRTK